MSTWFVALVVVAPINVHQLNVAQRNVAPSAESAAGGALGALDELDPGASAVLYDDDGPRLALRGAVRGTDDAPVLARFHDVVSGRTARALVGAGAVIQIDDATDVAAWSAARGVHARPLMARAGLYRVTAPGRDGVDLTADLAADVESGALLRASPDWIFAHQTHAIDVPPDDERYPGQFYLEDIAIEGAWRRGVGDASTTIVVVDNGCDAAHPDLVGKLDVGRDVIDGDDTPDFEAGVAGNEHGTACAGLAAASTDNGIGIAGACPECRVRCVRLLAETAGTPLSADVAAFDFALEVDAAVVSNSWGFVDAIPAPGALRTAVETVLREGRGGRGAVVVFAVGNDNRQIEDDELQAIDGVLGVGAVSNLGELTQFTNRGDAVDVVAPTGSIATDVSGADGENGGDITTRFGGTSSAAPLVAGVAALLVAAAPALTSAEVTAILEETARQSPFATPDERGHDDDFGYGLVQADLAMARALGDDGDSDGGPSDDPEPPAGCSCDAGRDTGAMWGLGLFLLSRPWRRRRRR